MTGLIPSSPVVWTVDNINVEDGVPWWKQAAQGRMDEWDGMGHSNGSRCIEKEKKK